MDTSGIIDEEQKAKRSKLSEEIETVLMDTQNLSVFSALPHFAQHTCTGRAAKGQSARYANQGPQEAVT